MKEQSKLVTFISALLGFGSICTLISLVINKWKYSPGPFMEIDFAGFTIFAFVVIFLCVGYYLLGKTDIPKRFYSVVLVLIISIPAIIYAYLFL